jgi:hypothetical protein
MAEVGSTEQNVEELMNPQLSLEQRVTALEVQMVQVRQQVGPPPKKTWFDLMSGAFENVPEFEEVVQYGREYRHADRPSDGN